MTKILLVEDDKSLREIYGVRLQAEGYEIVSAGDGEEALALAIKERPQLILSDVMMPKISGFDMLDILRSTTETKDIKVIMMTALSSEDQRERGEALGADKYLVKSQVGIEDVVRTVHEVLGDTPAAAATGNVFAQPTGPRTSMPTANMQPTQPVQQPQAPAPAAPQAPQAPSQPQTAAAPPQAAMQPQPQAPPQMPAAPVAQPEQPSQQPQTPAPTTPSAPPAPPQQPQTPAPASRLPSDSAPHRAPQNSGPQESALPRPTAPFSTDRPTGLGDRIIHPIEQSADGKRDLSALMAQELGDAPASSPAVPQQPQAPAPAAPQAPQAPQAPSQPQPAAAPPQAAMQPQPQAPPPMPATPVAQPEQPTQPAQQPQAPAPTAPSAPQTPPQQP